MKATCCRSSPSRSRIGRPYSSRSSSAAARRVSAKAISRRCSRQSSASKNCAERCEFERATMEYAGHLAVLATSDAMLAQVLAAYRNLEQLLGWFRRREIPSNGLDLIAQDEF